jgi:soluble lytic murein transglycosylase
MKALAAAVAAALVCMTFVWAQGRQEPDQVPPPATLAATEHSPLPTELSQYWYVPDAVRLRDAAHSGSVSSQVGRAVTAISRGDAATGLDLLRNLTLGDSPLSGYARYYEGVALQQLERLQEADAVLTSLVGTASGGRLGRAARLSLAEVAMALGDARRAESLLRAIVDEGPADDETLLTLAEVEEGLAHDEHAFDAYAEVFYGFPLSERSADAQAGLDRLGGRSRIERGREMARAERLFDARRFADAKKAFEALAAGSPAERGLILLRIAECDVHLGRHRAARDRLRSLVGSSERGVEARYYYLRAVRGLGDRASYVTLSRALAEQHPGTRWAAEALNDLASHYVIEDDDDSADRVFRQVLELFPAHQYAERAYWRVGWRAYRQGRFGEAATMFEKAAAAFPRADYRPSWLYWSGRARERLADSRAAAARYRLAVADYGSSYYGRLASRRLASSPEVDAEPLRPPSSPFRSATPPPTVGLMRALMEAGLHDAALAEVQYAQRTWGDSTQLQATSAWIRHQQARSLKGEARFVALRGSITTMRRAYPQFLSAAGEDIPPDVLRLIFPLDYWDLVSRYASEYDLDPFLLAALMAQESTFTPEIRSSAGAHGLMQVMPATGRLYARRLGIRPFSTASLSQPEINVRIGVRYFTDLIERFGGAHYALAGYNAGDSRVAAWIAENPNLPADEFVDSIPFPETQNYVKRILGTAEDYRRLYGSGLLTPGDQPAAAVAD